MGKVLNKPPYPLHVGRRFLYAVAVPPSHGEPL